MGMVLQEDPSDPLEAEQIEMANLQRLNTELSKPASGDSSCSHAEEAMSEEVKLRRAVCAEWTLVVCYRVASNQVCVAHRRCKT